MQGADVMQDGAEIISELNIFNNWNDNIQSFRPGTSEAFVLVFHAVHTSVSVS